MLRKSLSAAGPRGGMEDGGRESKSTRVVSAADQEALTTLGYISQVEIIVVEGPHGRLDEYLQVVDLLLNAKTLFEEREFAEGLRQIRQLLATAMADLEHEFKDMLERRSNQATQRLTRDELIAISIRQAKIESPVQPEQKIGDLGVPPVPEPPSGEDMAVAFELLPPATVTWLAQIADRMRLGAAGAKCCEVYRLIRSDFLLECLRKMGTAKVCELTVENMPWAILEKTCKEWIIQMDVLVDVLLRGEFDLCSRVLDGLGSNQGRAFAEIVRQTAVILALRLVKLAQEISSKRLPEQLFAMLDMFSAIEDLSENVEKVFCGPGSENVKQEFKGLPLMFAKAVLAAFDQLRNLLQDSTSTTDSSLRGRLPLPSFLRGARADADDGLLPRGGGIHSITSYVVNYIRGYLHRLGRKNYVKILEKVFKEFGSSGTITRTVERETASLVMVLRKFLEAKANLYRDEVLRSLFLMNNINYLFRAMLLWHGWHGRGLLQALSASRREGNRDVQLALTDLQDDRIVDQFSIQFQRVALEKIIAILGDPVTDRRRGGPAEQGSEAEVKHKLKKFNLAFNELCVKQHDWVIADEELKTRIRGQMSTLMKERYRKLLLPYWDNLTHSKHYVYPVEDIELKIMRFFARPNTGED